MYFNLKMSSFAPFYFKLERMLISILLWFRENKLSNQRSLKSASRKRETKFKAGIRESKQESENQSRIQRIKAFLVSLINHICAEARVCLTSRAFLLLLSSLEMSRATRSTRSLGLFLLISN